MKKSALLIVVLVTLISASTTRTAYSVFFSSTKIGYILLSREAQRDTIITKVQSYTSIKRGKEGPKVTSNEEFTSFESTDGKLYYFVADETENDLERSYYGKVTDNDSISIQEKSRAGSKQYSLPWGTDALLFEGIRLNHESAPPVPGKTYSFTTLSTSSMEPLNITRTVINKDAVTIGNQTDSLYKVESVSKTERHSLKQILYVDEAWKERKAIQIQGGMEIVLIECPEDSAKAGLSEYDIISATLIKAPSSSNNVRYATSATYTLSIPPTLQLPSSCEQKIRTVNDTITEACISRVYISNGVLYPLVNIPTDKENYLKSSRYIECEDSLIKSMAKKAVRKTKRAKRALNRIRRYVKLNVYPSMATGYATALETALRKEGDCTEFALLTTALCRAAHIPARVATGIVCSPFTGKYFYHAWTQAFVDGKWVSIDAALGRFDPGHIALSFNDDGAPDLKIVDYTGAIKILNIDAK